jgi:hypothetical protein
MQFNVKPCYTSALPQPRDHPHATVGGNFSRNFIDLVLKTFSAAAPRKMENIDAHEAHNRWQHYPCKEGYLTLANCNVDRRRRLLEVESPRLFMEQTNQFKILHALASGTGNENCFSISVKWRMATEYGRLEEVHTCVVTSIDELKDELVVRCLYYSSRTR